MSEEDAAAKEFEPTPRKLEKARKDGDVPLGQDLVTASVYASLLLVMAALGSGILLNLGAALATYFRMGADASWPLSDQMTAVASSALPLLLAPVAGALLAVMGQNAFQISAKRIQPKLNKISPIQGVKKKLGANGLFEFFKSTTKLCIFSALLVLMGLSRLDEVVALAALEGRAGFSVLLMLCRDFMLAATLCVAAIAMVDLLWQRASHVRKNRMTRKELTDETKESEGDPYLKQARRAKAQEIATNQMLADVPKADVIITNPTHFAVALKWSRLPGSAPECVAKGRDFVALRIREAASDANVPIFEDPPTARLLCATVGIGSEIHPDHYRAVAVAIRFADQIRGKGRT